MTNMHLYKAGEKVAWGNLTYQVKIDKTPELSGADLDLYYFQRIFMSPAVVFFHFAGKPLSTWLDMCNGQMEGSADLITSLRYVHGRSEVMKGSHTISAVLLARVAGDEVPEAEWMASMPQVYRRFTALLNTRDK